MIVAKVSYRNLKHNLYIPGVPATRETLRVLEKREADGEIKILSKVFQQKEDLATKEEKNI